MFDDVVSHKNIPPKHDNDNAFRQKISNLFENGCDSKDELCKAMEEWMDEHEAHLKLEESVMMPLTKQTADSERGRGEIVRKIINVNYKEFTDFQFEYVLRQLMDTKPFGPVMMYCKAVQMSSNQDEYEQIVGKIEEIVDEEMWEKLKAKGVDGTGEQRTYDMFLIKSK